MKMNNLKLLALLFGAIALPAASAHAALITFDTAADIGEFAQIRSNAPSSSTLAFSQSSAAGTGAGPSGGVVKTDVGTNNGNNDIVAVYTPGGVYADSAIAFGVGDSLSTAIKFKTSSGSDANLAATPRLGLAGWSSYDATATSGTSSGLFYDTANNASRFIFGGNNNNNGNNPTDSFAISPSGSDGAAKNLELYATVAGNVGARQVFSDTSDDALLASDQWYEMLLQVTKTAVADTFEITGVLYELNADGTSRVGVAQIAALNEAVVSPSMYAESAVVAGFSWTHNAAPAGMAAEMDDFLIVPEPGSALLIGALFGLFGLAGAIRFRLG